MAGKLAFLQAITALHCGTGQGVGSIDLPIARERATGLPVVPGSTIKGCLRDALGPGGSLEKARLERPTWLQIFGPERGKDASEFAGALRISDARLLLLPVRCLAGTFAWVTSPFTLLRLARDARAAGPEVPLEKLPALGDGKALAASGDVLARIGGKERLVLEELDFEARVEGAGAVAAWISERLYGEKEAAWRAEFVKRFAIVDDKSFAYLSEFSTELVARIRMNAETGTVDAGALWYQEALPAETVCYTVMQADATRDGKLKGPEVLAKIPETSEIQFGGKATTGLGVARLVPVGGGQ